MMYCKLISKIKRQGGVQSIAHNRLRYSLTIINHVMSQSNREVKASNIIKYFLQDKSNNDIFLFKVRIFHG